MIEKPGITPGFEFMDSRTTYFTNEDFVTVPGERNLCAFILDDGAGSVDERPTAGREIFAQE